MGIDTDELAGELLALRLVVQRLYARLAKGSQDRDAFLEIEREGLLDTLRESSILGLPSEADAKGRAEYVVNDIFDGIRLSKGSS